MAFATKYVQADLTAKVGVTARPNVQHTAGRHVIPTWSTLDVSIAGRKASFRSQIDLAPWKGGMWQGNFPIESSSISQETGTHRGFFYGRKVSFSPKGTGSYIVGLKFAISQLWHFEFFFVNEGKVTRLGNNKLFSTQLLA